MSSNEGANDRRVSPERFGMVQLELLPHWIEAGLVSVQGAVNICLLSWTKEDEAGRRYSWFPADDMAALLGVQRKSVSDAIRRLKERGFITVKEKGRKGRCTEYYLTNPSKEEAPVAATADAEKTGSSLPYPIEPHTSDPIIPVQSIEHVESGRYLPASGSHSESKKPVSTHTGMRRDEYAALKESGAFKIGNWNA